MINIVIAGYKGRMGGLIAKLVDAADDLTFAGGADIDAPLADVIDKADVVIDFTRADAAATNIELAAEMGKPIIIGTTGLSEEQRAQVKKASERIPVIHAPNMSLGVNVLFHMINTAAKTLGDDFQIEINETHHTKKLDKPSGTAKRMQEVASAGGRAVEMHAFREGDVVGDHSISFDSPEEVLEIRHHAKTRKLFARGAVTAARWIAGKPAGLYDMSDVLGLK
jgi:4-hydroxy-tetrahydrodipicolinate reductase